MWTEQRRASAQSLPGLEEGGIYRHAKGLLVEWRAGLGRGSVIGTGPHLQCPLTCSATCSHSGETQNGWMDQGPWLCGPCGKKSQEFKKVQCDGEKLKECITAHVIHPALA